MTRRFTNLFRMPDGSLSPSVPYDTREEAERYQNATSFARMEEKEWITVTPTDADHEWAEKWLRFHGVSSALRVKSLAEALAATRAEALEQACVIIAQHCGVNPRSETWAHVAKIERDVRALIATPAETEKK